jgi:cytochrome P450
MEVSVEPFVPLSDEMLADPYSVYAQLRRDDPVHWHEQLGAWVLLRHADCVQVLADPATFRSDFAVLGQEVPDELLGIQTLDGPEHTAIRHLMLRALRLLDLRGWVAESLVAAEKLIADLDTDDIDFVADLNEPLALASMCLLFGVPDFGDPDRFHAAQQALVLSMDAGLDPSRARPGLEARGYLSAVLARHVADPPRIGLLSMIKTGSNPYLINTLRAAMVAGFLSSSSMLSCAVRTLAEAGLLDGDQPVRVDLTAYNELVRHSGAVQVESRGCAADIVVGGQRLRRGDEVISVLAAANRDPAVFARPDELAFDRSPNPHLGFGRGTHSCVGASIAAGLHVPVLTRLSERYRIAPAGPPTVRRTGTLRGYTSLPLTFDRR